MGDRREVRGTNQRVREPVRSGNEEPVESKREYLQRLAERLIKPKHEDSSRAGG